MLCIEKNGKYILNVTGHDKDEDKNMIPISRLNQEIEKRKASEKALQEVCDRLIEDVPEDKRSIIPDLPPSKKIAWLKTAFKMDFFSEKQPASLDSKRPGDKSPSNYENMNPIELIEHSLKKSKT